MKNTNPEYGLGQSSLGARSSFDFGQTRKIMFSRFFVLNKASFCLIRFDNNEHNFWFRARLDYTYYSAFFVYVCVYDGQGDGEVGFND